jgi:hypothetical protein
MNGTTTHCCSLYRSEAIEHILLLGRSAPLLQENIDVQELYGHMQSFESQDDNTSNIDKAPADFKTGSKWKPYKKGIIAYLNSIKGTHSIPLAYVIQEHDIPEPNQVYQSEHHCLIEITPLAGIELEEDNGKAFDLLKSWTLNGPAWTWMQVFIQLLMAELLGSL